MRALANDVFIDVRNRITQNTLLKMHHFFLIPLQNQISASMHGRVSALSEAELEAGLLATDPVEVRHAALAAEKAAERAAQEPPNQGPGGEPGGPDGPRGGPGGGGGGTPPAGEGR